MEPRIWVMVARNTDCGALNQDQVSAALKAHPEWLPWAPKLWEAETFPGPRQKI